MRAWNLRSNILAELELSKTLFGGLLISSLLRTIGLGAITLFLPIYIYKLGGLYFVVAYVLISRFVQTACGYWIGKTIAKIGLRRSVVISEVLLSVSLLLFKGAEQLSWFLWLGAVIVPFAIEFYWIPYHLMFVRNKSREFGKDAGILAVVSRWGGVLGPLLGGLMVGSLGFGGLFNWGVIFVLISSLSIFLVPQKELNWEFHLESFERKISGMWFRKDLLAYVGYGIESVMYDFFWPVFLFVVLGKSHILLGNFKTAVLLVSSILFLFVGRSMDHEKMSKWTKFAMVAMAIIWVLRGVLRFGSGLWVLDILDGWIGVFVFLPFEVYGYRRARVADSALYVVEREVSDSLGRFLGAGIVGLFYWWGWEWNAMVYVGILGLSMMLFLPREEAKLLREVS